jgi:riboflavin kinase/FMN adenylyltransferase
MKKHHIDTIAIGGFDGMHIGHQKLFDELGVNGAIVVIETGYANLTPGRERECHTPYPIVYHALEEIRHLEGAEFIEMLRHQFPDLKKIVVGYDFHFGKNRRYSHADLRELFEGEVKVVEQVCLDGDSVHSHKIRAKIQIGEIGGANLFLGHDYTVKGSMIKGQGLGAKELVPTVNLEVSSYQLPREGVYATRTRIAKEWFASVSFLGHRSTTDGSFAIETHILDRQIAEPDGEIEIRWIAFIRENRKFEGLDALRAQIMIDINAAKSCFGN